MSTTSAPLFGNRLEIDLPGATITLIVCEESCVIAESGRATSFGKSTIRRLRIIRWADDPVVMRFRGTSIVVKNTGPAYASGSGSRANSGVDYGNGSSWHDGADCDVTIGIPSGLRNVTIKRGSHYSVQEGLDVVVEDRR
jgi:hypothetical protein